MSDDLKPCPFCGCNPDGYEGPQISCRCGALGPIEVVGDEHINWNTRYQAAEIERLTARVTQLEAALEWYAEQARLCRLIHSEGDSGRHALQEDGGNKARTTLAALKGQDDE